MPTEAERVATLHLANRLIEHVRDDEHELRHPLYYQMRARDIESLDGVMFRLAQDLVGTRRALDEALELLSRHVHSTQAPERIDKLRRLDFDD